MTHQEMADHIARERIMAHEKQCAERWQEARKVMEANASLIRWLIAILILGQGAVIGFLADRLH